MERTARNSARAATPWLAAAVAATLSLPVLAAPAGAAETGAPAGTSACAYGYTSQATVWFGADADSGVPNRETRSSCTVMDEIMADAPFASHGAFVRTVASVTRGLVRERVLTGGERRDVVHAAAVSEVGRPHPVTGGRSVDLAAIGLVGYTVRATMPTDAAGTLAALAACGFRNIEPSGSAGNFYGYSAAGLAPLTEAAGLEVPSLGVSLSNLQNDVDLVVAEAHAIGARYVRVSGSGSWTLADYSRTAAILNEAGERLSAEGIRVAYHNHGFEFETAENGVTGYDVLVRETNPAFVTMELDVYWAASTDTAATDLFARYPGRFELLHLKDIAEDGSFADVGAGTIDFAEIFAAAPLAGVRYGFTEHDQPSPDGVTSACTSLGYLAGLRY
ncbi:sugar phosphate isomerase/epimerase [Promicromonospora sp. MEB111]|uniref:sugar phosphate isomerase/epimerase family protein n=1 Tax=Promicromonospora sp. MEB111 TaxID=3040301 RepID=UPI002550CA64|nr:sugar phosphate isomerase/epimerase [Promicromonospora sp. MEB111]